MPVPLDDDRLVAHRRDVGAAGRARAHDEGDLRDPGRRHPGLVVEDPAEVVAVGEDVGLERQEGAAAVDEVDARQPVLERDLLGAEVLLDRHRVVGAALDRGVVGDDDAGRALDPADPGDDPGAGRVVVVQAGRGERAQLEEGRAGVEQAVDPLADRELAALAVAGDRAVVAAGAAAGDGRPGGRGGRRRGRPSRRGWRASRRAAGSSRLRRTGMAAMIGRVHGNRTAAAAVPRPCSDSRRVLVLARRWRRRSSPRVAAPAATADPRRAAGPLVTVETRGGECFAAPCGHDRHPRARRHGPLGGQAAERPRHGPARPARGPATRRSATTDFAVLKSRPFTGECPTAFDGQEIRLRVRRAERRRSGSPPARSTSTTGSPLFVAVVDGARPVRPAPDDLTLDAPARRA